MKRFTLLFLILASTASAQTIHVPGDYPTIQQGIDAAQPGDTVLVADGIYYEQITINKKPLLVTSKITFNGDSSHLYNTIIDGSYLVSPNQSVVLFYNVDSTARLSGFTIQNGRGTKIGSELSGGGIRILNSGAKISYNRIINNLLNGGPMGGNCNAAGAGIVANYSINSWIVITDNIIQGNQCISNDSYAFGGGGYIRTNTRFANNYVCENLSKGLLSSSPEGAGFCFDGTGASDTLIVTSNMFINNVVQGESGAVYCAGLLTVRARCTISNNEFTGNQAIADGNNITVSGALTLGETTGTHYINNNLFKENISGRAAAIYAGIAINDSVIIENNTFIKNEALQHAGAIYSLKGPFIIRNNVFNQNHANGNGGALNLNVTYGSATDNLVVNNTFAGNTASGRGGAIYASNFDPLLLNNIFWDNKAPAGADISIVNGEAYIAYCNIDESKIEGPASILEGVQLQDPLFCDTTCLMIPELSPCKDSGVEYYVFAENDTLFAPRNDNMGIPRPMYAGFDMGAHEYFNPIGVTNLERLELSVYPNPFNSILYCQYRLDKSTRVSITVYDLTGRTLYNETINQKRGEYTIPVHLDGLKKGLFLIKIQAGDRVAVRKIIVKD